MKPHYRDVIDRTGLLRPLAPFDPIIIGTPPLGIAIESSDIDIACSAPDLDVFSDASRHAFGQREAFSLTRIETRGDTAVVASFRALRWEIELFCQTRPTRAQWGVRHFRVEERLLALRPDLRAKVLRLKRDAMKTEPAFACVLSLSGDPYRAMLRLEALTDDEMRRLIDATLSASETSET